MRCLALRHGDRVQIGVHEIQVMRRSDWSIPDYSVPLKVNGTWTLLAQTGKFVSIHEAFVTCQRRKGAKVTLQIDAPADVPIRKIRASTAA